MASLDKIAVRNFRNIEMADLGFSPNINCISGNNGEGKTNLLDAIYYLSMTKSAFSTSDKFNYRYGTDDFSLAGTYRMGNGLSSRVSIHLDNTGKKSLKRDEKAYDKISDHIGEFPVVMVSPSDISLVSDSGEERRRFMNSVLSQMDRTYLADMQQYNRLLAQRNKMLKQEKVDEGLLEVFDGRMSVLADRIYHFRNDFVTRLGPVVSQYYNVLSGGMEEVSITYESDIQKGDLESVLRACRKKDLLLRYTSAGVQRDDLLFNMNGYPIRRCGSQGQQKSFLVSLKFAQYEIMKQSYGFAPILLLDDVFDKLDMNRISNLLEMVAGQEFGQIFITDSNKIRMANIVDAITEDRAYFVTSGGTFTQEDLAEAPAASEEKEE